jgi:streptogramin lyase
MLLSFCLAIVTMLLMGAFIDVPIYAESNEATAIDATFGLEFAVPNGPRNITEETPERIWYTSPAAGGIGYVEVITQSETISGTEPLTGTENSVVRYRTEFFGFGEKSEPYDLVYSDGFVWFTLRGIRALGKMDVETHDVEIFTLLSVGAAPTGIALAPDGKLWIAQSNGRISSFDPTTELFVEYFLPDSLTDATRTEDIYYQNARNIWFTMPDANRVVVYNSARDSFFSIPTDHQQPMNIAVDPNGVAWVTAFGSGRVGRFSPTTVSIWIWFETPTPDGGPGGILIFEDENGFMQLWLTEYNAGTMVRMQFSDTFVISNQEKLGPNAPSGNTWGIIRASDGDIWVADTGRNLLYELKAPYIQRVYAASIKNAQPPVE